MKIIKKILLPTLIIAAMVSPAITSADSITNNNQRQALIAELQVKLQQLINQYIQELQTELQELQKQKQKEDSLDVKVTIPVEENKVTKKKTTKKPLISSPQSITERVASSSSSSQNDTAILTYQLEINPFDNQIFIPVLASQALDFDLVDASTNQASTVTDISLSSSADRVEGRDGRDYFRISNQEDLSISITAQPGAGTYFGLVNSLGISTVDVRSSNPRVIPIRLSPRSWQSGTINLLN